MIQLVSHFCLFFSSQFFHGLLQSMFISLFYNLFRGSNWSVTFYRIQVTAGAASTVQSNTAYTNAPNGMGQIHAVQPQPQTKPKQGEFTDYRLGRSYAVQPQPQSTPKQGEFTGYGLGQSYAVQPQPQNTQCLAT